MANFGRWWSQVSTSLIQKTNQNGQSGPNFNLNLEVDLTLDKNGMGHYIQNKRNGKLCSQH